jgi:hypothetical protein
MCHYPVNTEPHLFVRPNRFPKPPIPFTEFRVPTLNTSPPEKYVMDGLRLSLEGDVCIQMLHDITQMSHA